MTDQTKSRRIPAYTWLGVLILIAAEVFLMLDVQIVITWFTPVMWSGYILAVDGLLYKRTGASWLTDHVKEFLLLIPISVGVWVLFEVYNFHLQNWYYLGVPKLPPSRLIAYFWSFATIIPGVFLTSQIIESLLTSLQTNSRSMTNVVPRNLIFLTGIVMVTLPLTVPTSIARYLFGSVWIGFIFLIDPINEIIGAPSLRRMLELGRRGKITALLIGGFICGLLWEAWNFQAFINGGGHWVYTVPGALRVFNLHYGQMPVLGMLGFPPFALELYVMYHFLRKMLEGPRIIGPTYW